MLGFISKKAVIRGVVSRGAVIYGPTEISEGCFVDDAVIGYPTRGRLMYVLEKSSDATEALDEVSLGAYLGPRCIVRSGCIIYEEVMMEDSVELGHGVLIRSGSVVRSGSRIGSFTQLDGKVLIGKNVNIQSNVYLPHLTKILDDAFLGPGVTMTNDLYPVASALKGPTIGAKAIIGSRAVILPGVNIGEGAVVGAGSVVTRDVKPYTVVYGVPAREVYSREEYERRKAMYELKEG